MKKAIIWFCECKRCGHRWSTRKPVQPLTCARCRSPYWNRKRINPEKDKVTA